VLFFVVGKVDRLSTNTLNVPFRLAQRAQVSALDPLGHAAVVKRMVAITPNDF
jgi:hypothetical protein